MSQFFRQSLDLSRSLLFLLAAGRQVTNNPYLLRSFQSLATTEKEPWKSIDRWQQERHNTKPVESSRLYCAFVLKHWLGPTKKGSKKRVRHLRAVEEQSDFALLAIDYDE